MKKLAIFACVMVVSAGAAIASTVNIPFFADGNPQAFVGLQNTSAGDVTITVTYFGSFTPGSQESTAVLASGEAVSWRPFDTNPANGEVQITQNEAAAILAGNTSHGIGDSTDCCGSIIVKSSGSLVGRFVQFNPAGTNAFAHNVEITP